jgi:hypothetical protein
MGSLLTLALAIWYLTSSEHVTAMSYNCSDQPAGAFDPITLVSKSGALKLSFIPYGGTVTAVLVDLQEGESPLHIRFVVTTVFRTPPPPPP